MAASNVKQLGSDPQIQGLVLEVVKEGWLHLMAKMGKQNEEKIAKTKFCKFLKIF